MSSSHFNSDWRGPPGDRKSNDEVVLEGLDDLRFGRENAKSAFLAGSAARAFGPGAP